MEIADKKTLRKASKVIKDTGNGRLCKDNMKEHGGSIESDNTVIQADGYVNHHNIQISTTGNTVSIFHSHQSVCTEKGMQTSDYPSRADINNAKSSGRTDYLFVPRTQMLIIYTGNGVVATMPMGSIYKK